MNGRSWTDDTSQPLIHLVVNNYVEIFPTVKASGIDRIQQNPLPFLMQMSFSDSS